MGFELDASINRDAKIQIDRTSLPAFDWPQKLEFRVVLKSLWIRYLIY